MTFSLTFILNILLITDIISDHLTLPDILRCRQVNSEWFSLFRPYLWKTIDVRWIIYPVKIHGKMNLIQAHQTWIRSLTCSSNHIDFLSKMNFNSSKN
jgi:hypothetical protein